MDYKAIQATAVRLLKNAGQPYTLYDLTLKKLGILSGINNDKEIRLDGAVIGVQTGVMLAVGSIVPTVDMFIEDSIGERARIQIVKKEAPAGITLYYEVITK